MKREKEKSFDELVRGKLRKIPQGKVTTYGEVARVLGNPKAARAVGNACNRNPHAPKVPCHRVVKSNGEVGGFAGGKRKKIELLRKEGVGIIRGKITNLEGNLFSFQ
ncbi:MAG: MGMT family protein [Candidatus Diapherotrites archaeon]